MYLGKVDLKENNNNDTFLVQSTSKKCSKVRKPFQCPFKNGNKLKFKEESIDTLTSNTRKITIHSNTKNKPFSKCILSTEIKEFKQALNILNNYEKELNTRRLIRKWRCITQGAMSYILNMTLCKIDKIGGYEELRKKEFDLQKKRLEYMMDDSMQDEMDTIIESEDFKSLPIDDQVEYQTMMDERLKNFQIHKQNELDRLEKQMNNTTNSEMNMEELAERLKVDYKMVFTDGSQNKKD